MNLLSYDVEIYDNFPEDGSQPDLKNIRPSIAGIGTKTDKSDFQYFYEQEFMGKKTCRKLVKAIMDYYEKGFIPFGWNSLSFDFKLLAVHSEMFAECSMLALNHIDPMFEVVCRKGHMLGLDKVLIGCGLESKLHQVQLKDGTMFSEMSGIHAPKLWRDGNYFAVRDYLEMDILQPLKLAEYIEKTKNIQWTSNSGKSNRVKIELLTVKECLKLPLPNVEWMASPKRREEFYSWIHPEIIKEYV